MHADARALDDSVARAHPHPLDDIAVTCCKHDVVALVRTGATVDEVTASFPRLTQAQVYECLAYYEDHKDELDPLVAAQTQHLDE
jgi:Protein of unknown function (DUF433)